MRKQKPRVGDVWVDSSGSSLVVVREAVPRLGVAIESFLLPPLLDLDDDFDASCEVVQWVDWSDFKTATFVGRL